ncbi:MAG TPA: DUF4129 domain-containing protein, partial [Chloroflexota bacterium]|nr:DUF4129 domain-containing protein [Chloroflexota bacterium]
QLRRRLRRRPRRPVQAAAGPPRTVRELYRRLLRHVAALGHARAAPETPQEYLERLQRLPLPDAPDAALLTAAYMRVRYGDEPEHAQDIEEAREAWERLERALDEVEP